MGFRCYHKEGVFSTTDQPFDGEYDEVFDVSEQDAIEIGRGADLTIVDGELMLDPMPYPPAEPVTLEGEYSVVAE